MLGGTPEAIGDAYLRFNIAKSLRKIRAARGRSARQLATQLGVTAEQVARIEAGQVSLPTESLVRILGALDVAVAEFFRDVLASDRGPAPLRCLASAPSNVVDLRLVHSA